MFLFLVYVYMHIKSLSGGSVPELDPFTFCAEAWISSSPASQNPFSRLVKDSWSCQSFPASHPLQLGPSWLDLNNKASGS